MPYVSKDQLAQAREMDLLTYLRLHEPEELVHFSGNTYTTSTHDSLKISNGKWCWWSHGIGGSTALDYLVSAPVIKCKKTPRKKCRFVAERRKKR